LFGFLFVLLPSLLFSLFCLFVSFFSALKITLMTDGRFCSSLCSSFCSRFLFFLLTVFFVLLISSSSGFVSAQRCVDFNSTSAASICQPYVDYDYFLPEGPTEWISKSFFFFRFSLPASRHAFFCICCCLSPVLFFTSPSLLSQTVEALTSYNIHLATLQATLLPTKCEKKLLAFICAQGYQRCKTFEDGSVAARPVCYSLCEEVGETCAEAFAAGGQSAPDCSAHPKKTSEGMTDEDDDDDDEEEEVHKPTYASTSQVLVKGETRTVSCFTTDNDLKIPEFPFDCGFPLAYDKSVEDTMGFPCASKLKLFLLTILNPFLLTFSSSQSNAQFQL
jgi:hypothetical protein